eukprot:scaffold6871_cov75-Phaeocystis_antarctica.AAC.2
MGPLAAQLNSCDVHQHVARAELLHVSSAGVAHKERAPPSIEAHVFERRVISAAQKQRQPSEVGVERANVRAARLRCEAEVQHRLVKHLRRIEVSVALSPKTTSLIIFSAQPLLNELAPFVLLARELKRAHIVRAMRRHICRVGAQQHQRQLPRSPAVVCWQRLL